MFEILKQRMQQNANRIALASGGKEFTYSELLAAIEEKESFFKAQGIGSGSVVTLIGDFSFVSLASLLALFVRKATVIPLTKESFVKLKPFVDQMDPNYVFDTSEFINNAQSLKLLPIKDTSHWKQVIPKDVSGLVVFTSGSTGVPKGIVHNVDSLCYRYLDAKEPVSSICFLLFDHMGGINTVLFLLFRGGTAVHVSDRQVESVCSAVEKYHVELLPTTPSFLSQLLITRAYQNFNLSSLKVVSYGTEVMSEVVLKKMNEVLPNCTFKQTYGLSETGVLQIKSKSNDSLWFKFIDAGVEHKIVDQVLWIKTKSNLLAKILFTDLGIELEKNSQEWFCTNDLVETENEYLKIMGRQTDIINVAGLKVYPSEVENCILDCDFVDDVIVKGKKHPLLGNIVTAHVLLKSGIEKTDAEKLLRKHCLTHLEKFKVPSKFIFEWDNFVNDRFKKIRTAI